MTSPSTTGSSSQHPEHSLEHATAQQRIAADPTSSVWVSANAGTGKTRVLIDRISRLLLCGVKPEKILCLTFTKAAAAEMENRLSGRLGEWAVMADGPLRKSLVELLGSPPEDDDLLRARRLFAESLEAPGGLKIRTIHAFCESLLGRFPIEANVAPHVSVMDDRAQAELMFEARERVYRRAFGDPASDIAVALESIAGLLDEGSFDDILNELLSKRERLKHAHEILGSPEDMDKAIQSHLGLEAGETHEIILLTSTHEDAFDRAGLEAAVGVLKTSTSTDQHHAEKLEKWLAANHEDRSRLLEDEYFSIFLTDKRQPRSESRFIAKAIKDNHPAIVDTIYKEQARVFALAEKLKAAAIARDTSYLVRIGTAVIDHYEALKHARALMDYDDLILKALGLLQRDQGASWVHFKLDGGIDHILVDEAQDTSPEQWQVIRHLADEFFVGEGVYESRQESEGTAARPLPRTIFAVGDKKQSIYSFQGADPDGFLRMQEYFETRARAVGNTVRPVELIQSFRTTSAVLNVVDAVFQRPEAQAGVSDETGTRHFAQRKDHAGIVELWPALQKEATEEPGPWDAPVDRIRSSSPMARTAEIIASTIARWLDTEEILESKDRPIEAGDIMILVPKRGQFAEEMVRRLKARNIPVAGSDRMILSEQIAVMDLMAAARFALLPEDDLTLATVLKGPFVSLNETDLFELAHKRTDTLWQALKDRATTDKTEKWCGPLSVLEGLLAKADYCPPFEFFTRLLGSGGGRRRLLARLGPEANDPIDEFLAQTIAYERNHVSSLQGFLAWFEAGGTNIKRDMDAGRGQVRVMTVHGSKGLEANIVILPDTCSEPKSTSRERVLWTGNRNEDHDNAPPLPLWPGVKANETAQCTGIRDGMKAARLEEYRRLLYVAMTRARDRLYVMGWERGKRSDKKAHGRDEGSWFELIRPAIADMDKVEVIGASGGDGEDATYRQSTPQTAPPETEQESGPDTKPEDNPPMWLFSVPSPEPEPNQPLSPSRPDGEEPPVIPPFSGDDTSRFRRGNLIHRLLQTLPDLAVDNRRQAAMNWLTHSAADLDKVTRKAIVDETLEVLETSDLVDVFGPGSLPEVAIAGTVETADGPRTIAGQVDRLVITERTVTIVDYKTNRPPPASETDVPEAYLRQMALYKSALEHIYPDRVIRCLLVWTDGPHGMVLDNDRLGLYTP